MWKRQWKAWKYSEVVEFPKNLGSSQLTEKALNYFKFNSAATGTVFRVVITKTPLSNGYAFYRVIPNYLTLATA